MYTFELETLEFEIKYIIHLNNLAHRGCKNPIDIFGYVCRFYVAGKQISYKIQRNTKYSLAYHLYFGMPIDDQDKS